MEIFLQRFNKFNKEEKFIGSFKSAIDRSLSNWKDINYENITDDVFGKLNVNSYRAFVFSLSKKDDDLSQWRSYTKNALGFSIHFNFNENLILDQTKHYDPKSGQDPSLHNCRILLKECIYSDELKQEAFHSLLEHHYKKFKEESSRGFWLNELFFDILTLCLFCKNNSFEAEEECRIVVSIMYDFHLGENLINFKSGNSFLIPYIELDTVDTSIKGITIGPTPSAFLSMESLKILLQKTTKTNEFSSPIKLRLTKIPYRSW
ncbi:MAG: DUF2971 domain-containing protein [Cytophagaceae bacterium]|nr:DUF2971 domain-containing protein [Cytophagaceae bacterium]